MTIKKIPESEWKWFGISAHFICGQWCRFHMATQVGDYLISTVGEYVHPRHSGASERAEAEWLQKNWPGEDIGHRRKYETMVFKAGKEICSVKDCGCGIPNLDGHELDSLGYNERGKAQGGHMEICQKWSKR